MESRGIERGIAGVSGNLISKLLKHRPIKYMERISRRNAEETPEDREVKLITNY